MSLNLTYSYYPGCTSLSTASDYEVSIQAVCNFLNIDLEEVEDWSCCGSSPAHTVDHVLSTALSARNLTLASEMDSSALVTPCPSCLSNLKCSSHSLQDLDFKQKVDKLLDNPSKNNKAVKSLLQILYEDYGLENIGQKVQNPLQGVKVATYYGCIMNRPPGIMGFDDHENPVAMDEILQALGAEVLHFPLKVECCGASYAVPKKEIVMQLSGKLLSLARDIGADLVAVLCPLCQMNLDLRQDQINRAWNTQFNMPILYYTQLMGLAFGISAKELAIGKLNVSPKHVLGKL